MIALGVVRQLPETAARSRSISTSLVQMITVGFIFVYADVSTRDVEFTTYLSRLISTAPFYNYMYIPGKLFVSSNRIKRTYFCFR